MENFGDIVVELAEFLLEPGSKNPQMKTYVTIYVAISMDTLFIDHTHFIASHSDRK